MTILFLPAAKGSTERGSTVAVPPSVVLPRLYREPVPRGSAPPRSQIPSGHWDARDGLWAFHLARILSRSCRAARVDCIIVD